MRTWFSCFASQSVSRDSSPAAVEEVKNIKKQKSIGRRASNKDAFICSQRFPSLEESFLSALLSDMPSIALVFDMDCLDASIFAKQKISPLPLYQTIVASNYYKKALNLQGEKLTVRQVIGHLLGQHPDGLIPALREMHEAIKCGLQWNNVCCVKVPSGMKALQGPQPALISNPLSKKHQSQPSLAPTPAVEFLIPASRSLAKLSPQDSRDLSGHGGVPASRTMTFIRKSFMSEKSSSEDVGLSPKHSTLSAIHMDSSLKEEEVKLQEADHAFLWHKVVAKPFVDPISGKKLVIIQHHDISSQLEEISQLSQKLQFAAKCESLSERQLTLLSSTFPRHILEYLISLSDQSSSANVIDESRDHNSLLDVLPPAAGPSSRISTVQLPAPKYSDRISTKGLERLARSHNDVTILFMDIVGFTSMSKQVDPASIMTFLNDLFSLFDQLTDKYGVQKIETAGDCYVAAAGILTSDGEGFTIIKDTSDAKGNALRMLQFAKAMLIASKRVQMPHNGEPVLIRIGLHTGDCVTGVVGSKLPKFSVFGDTMNTASRMESTSIPGHIQVSESTWQLVKHVDQWKSKGGVEIKGKGMMNTYFWDKETISSNNATRGNDLRRAFSSAEDWVEVHSDSSLSLTHEKAAPPDQVAAVMSLSEA